MLPSMVHALFLPLQHLLNTLPGDYRLLISAGRQARTAFSQNSSLLPSSPEASAQIAHAEDVAKILRQNVVQGRKVDGETGEKYREFCWAQGSCGIADLREIELRIHEETERGDNETIKMAGKRVPTALGGCCGGR